MHKGIRMIRKLLEQPAFASLRGDEIFPGLHADTDEQLDTQLNSATASQWHLCGTARMGRPSDANTVVDHQGRVLGVNGLRVVDASIMPFATNGNINSPT